MFGNEFKISMNKARLKQTSPERELKLTEIAILIPHYQLFHILYSCMVSGERRAAKQRELIRLITLKNETHHNE